MNPLLSDGKSLAVVFPNISTFCVVPEYSFASDYLSRFGLTLNQIIYVSELENLVVTYQDGSLLWLEFAESASDGGAIDFYRSGCFGNPEQTHFSVEKQWLGNSYFRYIIDIVEYE